MHVELIMVALVVAYLGVAALAHGLVIAAVYRCWREDHAGGRRSRIGAGCATMIDTTKEPQPAH